MEGGKFVGGSALARKRARKAIYKSPLVKHTSGHGLQQSRRMKHSLRLPNRVSPSDRFFASLLLTSGNDIIDANGNNRWTPVISDICNRAGVPFPSKLNSTDHDMNVFYLMRASLVLEEARSILTEELSNRKRQRKSGIRVKLLSVEQKRNGFSALVFTKFEKNSQFIPAELYDMKPGCVVEVTFRDEVGCKRSVLTNIMPVHNADDKSIVLLVYRTEELDGYLNDLTSFHLVPVTSLISEQRQFVACFDRPKVAFLPKLMGVKSATHTRFDDSDDDSMEEEELLIHKEEVGETNYDGNDNDDSSDGFISFGARYVEEKKDDDDNDDIAWGNRKEDRIHMASISIPPLNGSQEKAATSFINGPAHNLSLVQGPPGTGKTTFMTAVLCRTFLVDYSMDKEYCHPNRDKRVLVAAPTNKAVSVLASRFMKATNSHMGLNVVLIGVEDALFPKDEDDDDALKLLRGIFVYTWVEELMNDLESLMLVDSNKIPILEEIEEVSSCAIFLVKKMKTSIPQLSAKFGSLQLGRAWLHMLTELPQKIANKDGDIAQVFDCMRDVNTSLSKLLSSLKTMKASESAVGELLNTANVIFSTLTSSGVSLMKRTRSIHELFVDEAAATTEAEIIIPLHLRPRRMLAVGDPKQLPASVTSQRAADFGLDKSLLDRLMFGCGGVHMMLDVQYRMSPAISKFPAGMFYNGKLQNGQNVRSPTYTGDISILHQKPYTVIHVDGQESRASSGSYYNAQEAKAVLRLVQLVRDASLDVQMKNWASIEKIRIITFYSGQVRAIKELLRSHRLPNITVATVDSSQGCEADIVIVSFVRSNGNSSSAGKHKVGFLNDDRRINVALTRAKFQLFCVGDSNTLLNAGAQTITTLVNDAKSRGLLFNQDLLK